METKKIAWNRRVNRPRLTKRVAKPLRPASTMEQRMLAITATLRVMPEKSLTLENIQDVFARLMYFNHAPVSPREVKAHPMMRKLARMNKVADWTKQ